jgi:hypothetical protein
MEYGNRKYRDSVRQAVAALQDRRFDEAADQIEWAVQQLLPNPPVTDACIIDKLGDFVIEQVEVTILLTIEKIEQALLRAERLASVGEDEKAWIEVAHFRARLTSLQIMLDTERQLEAFLG